MYNLLYVAIVLAIIVGALEAFGRPLTDPFRKIAWVGIVVLFVLGLIFLLLPGFPRL